MMELVDQVVRRFRVVNEFNENKNTIKSIDFSPNGETLISCSEDVIVIYDCETGTQVNKVNSKKYGVDLVRFTNLKNTAIYSSTKIDDTIRHLSLHDKSYITYFKGHSKKVVALCTSPVGDTFLSGSLDKTLRIWDLRSPTHQGLVELTGSPVAAFDPEGLVFAAGINSECIHLYDLRSYEKPFLSHEFKPENNSQWTNLKFSQDGKTMLISSNGTKIRLLDAYHSTPMRTFEDYLNKDSVPIEASFSPDSQYVFSGSTDGKVHVWNADTGSKVCVLNSNHVAPIQCVQFNPKFMMLASACSSMAFWLPSIKST